MLSRRFPSRYHRRVFPASQALFPAVIARESMETMNTSAHPYLLLTKQTYVALTDETLVFLDLRRDKYSCLERQHTRPIARALGLPAPDGDELEKSAEDHKCEDSAKVIEDLTGRGLVTSDPDKGKRAEFVTQYDELKEMLGYFPGEGPKVRFGDVVKFFKALVVTKSLLKLASMERIVSRVKRRKDRFRPKDSAPDEERLNRLVETYKILKPLFVTVKDQCLFNSLFLIEFLACYRVYPTWYFGVRLNEFYAHCWVQDRNIIYDDFIYNTSTNQPIMAV